MSLAWCHLVAAEPAAETSEKERAQLLVDEGFRRFSEGDFPEALAKFEAAFAIYPSEKLLVTMGTTLRHLGRNADAAATYRRYLADPRSDAERREEVERILRELELLTGRLRVEVDPPAASVLVDGRPLGGADVRVIELDPGTHTLIGVFPERPRRAETVEVVAGREITVKLTVEGLDISEPGMPPVQVAGIVLASVAGAVITLGAGFGGAAIVDSNAVDDHCAESGTPCDPEAASLAESALVKARVSTASLAIGGAMLASGVVLILVGWPDDEQSPVRPTAIVANDSLGFGVEGTW